MRNIYILLFTTLIFSFFGNTQCINADPFCTGTNYNFPNSTGVNDLGSVDCLSTTPNPAWYYMEIDQNGSMTIDISQQTAGGTAIDVDFIVWGPYSSITAACNGANPFPGNIGTGSSVVDCSFSPSATETATISNATVGQVYVMLLTNFSDEAGSITFSQTGGSGSADCSFTCGVNLTAVPTTCANNTYTINGVLSVVAGPGVSVPNSGTVTITNSCGGTQTFNAPFTNVPYSFTGLTANGAACTVTATFSGFPTCNTLQSYTAPPTCGATCAITSVTAVPGACAPATNTFGLTGAVSFNLPPNIGTLTVTSSCGGTQTLNPPFVSPMNYTLTGGTANGGACTVTASFSATTCTGNQSFTAPSACGCAISALSAVPSACANDLYNVSGNITFSAPPATGTLTVSGCGGTQTFNAPFASPLAYNFNGLVANGANCNVTATFSALSACTRTQAYVAPAACLNPPCVQSPLCASSITFPAGTNQVPASTTYPNNEYDCLGSSPNPAWYYMQIANPGTLVVDMNNSASADIDFILYGPYPTYNNALTFCNNFGNGGAGGTNTVVDCSYSGSATETAVINNAQTGEVYVLLITNFSNSVTNISFQTSSTSGTASTDCNIVTPSVCLADIGTYNTSLTGNTQSTTILCFGDQLNVTSNNNFVTPTVITGGTTPPVFDPGISWLAYSCPPTVALNPIQSAATSLDVADDPCFLGIYTNTANLTDINDMSIINGEPAGTFTNNTVYFVPITMYSIVDGLYSYVIMPNNDCYELGTPIAIQYLPQIVAVQNPNCANGTVAVNLTGGAPQVNGTNFNVVTGSQSPASVAFVNTSVANGGTIIIGNLTDGPYSFAIVDDNGCPLTISGVFTGPQSANITYPDNLYCLNEPNPIPFLVGNLGGVYTSGNGLDLDPLTGGINLATSTPGAYAITYTTPSNQCPATSTFNLTIEAFPIVDAGEDFTVCVGKQIILTGAGATSYSWNNGLQNGVPYLPNVGLTEFVLIGTSSAGCVGTDILILTVVGACDSTIDIIYWIPNTFTPDGDQNNQTFFPVFYSGFDPYSFDFYVFNRWGEQIWESHDVQFGWDGTYNDGMKCPDGTYTWKIRFKLLNNDEKQTVFGHVNLIR